MSGLLNAIECTQNTNRVLYTCPTGRQASLNMNVCNRNSNDTVRIRIAIVYGGISTLNDEYFIEYNTPLHPSGVLERTAIVLTEGQSIIVYSDKNNVGSQAWGITEDI